MVYNILNNEKEWNHIEISKSPLPDTIDNQAFLELVNEEYPFILPMEIWKARKNCLDFWYLKKK